MAANSKLARYNDKWLTKLDLPSDHNARLEEKNFQRYRFKGANLKGANLRKANLIDADLTDANLYRVQLKLAQLENAILFGADLQYADLRGAEGITENQLLRALKYKLAYHSDEWITKLSLPWEHNLKLDKRDFGGYRFHGENLEKVDFSKAKLGGADLSKTNMKDAILTDAVLCDTNLEGADLRGADLRGIRACQDQPPEADLFASVKTLYQARLDEPLQKQLKLAHPHLFSNPQGSGDGDN
jgi:uncharacterized protein YjbI with pentapeptide repeats